MEEQDWGITQEAPRRQEESDVGPREMVDILQRENAELREMLQQERGMRQLYAKKLEEAEEEWLEQVEHLQAYVQSVRYSLNDTSVVEAAYPPAMQPDPLSSSESSQMGHSPMSYNQGFSRQDSQSPVTSRRGDLEQVHNAVTDLKDSFVAKTVLLKDDGDFIREVTEGASLAPEMDPEFELQELIRKFKIWKKEFKDQLKLTAELLRKKNKERSLFRKSARRADRQSPIPRETVSDYEASTESASKKKRNSGFRWKWLTLRRSTQYT